MSLLNTTIAQYLIVFWMAMYLKKNYNKPNKVNINSVLQKKCLALPQIADFTAVKLFCQYENRCTMCFYITSLIAW